MAPTQSLIALAALACLAAPLAAGEVDPQTQRNILESASRSLVHIEYRVKYDKGDAPTALNLAEKCPNCGGVHGGQDLSDYVKEERPISTAGYLIDEATILGKDILVHPRFIESISAVYGDERVPLSLSAIATDRPAAFFRLQRPLTGATALNFAPDADGPFFAVNWQMKDGRRVAHVREFSPPLALREDGAFACPLAADQLIVNAAGQAVTVTLCEASGDANAWKQPPASWHKVDAADMASQLMAFDDACKGRLVRVALSFRSPKKAEASRSYYSDDDDDAPTEQNAVGLVVGPRQVLVLSNLKPKATARLKRIVVHLPDDQTARATFSATLRDYGAFLATTESDLPAYAVLSQQNIESVSNQLLLFAKVLMHGETRIAYFQHGRIAEFTRRWGDRLFPTIHDDDGGWVIFSPKLELVCLGVPRRQKVSVEERWGSDESLLLPAGHLAEILADLGSHADPNNIPLTEEEENRIAWLGVEMQSLGSELARANKVSDRTRDGEIGGMVSHVYPGSPAAEAGIELGDILLALHVDGEPKPIDVQGVDSGYGGEFPWDRWDELPEQYFDSIPRPWPSADNELSQALTRLGFGKPFALELFRNGEVKRLKMSVVQSPPHYDSARKHKNDTLGLTLRDLTYEVRRYFQKTDDEPGLIISKIEPGSKASVAGLKPYEIITHVNDEPVANVGDFKERVKDQQELRFTVKRMMKGRIVRIALDANKPDGDSPAGDADDEARMTAESEDEDRAPDDSANSEPAETRQAGRTSGSD